MLQMKIFSALEFLKKTEALQPHNESDTIKFILDRIKEDQTNINDAYVVLSFLNKVSGEVLKTIKDQTIEQIRTSGDDTGIGVKLSIETTRNYNYETDKAWSDLNKLVNIHQDAKNKREKELQDAARSAEAQSQPPCIQYQIELNIVPKITPVTH